MKEKQKYYWGIGLENETYLRMDKNLSVDGSFVQENMGCERYSIDYRTCYKEGVLNSVLQKSFDKSKTYVVSRMINSHTLDKVDKNFQHRTIANTKPLEDNPEFDGKSFLDLFLETQPYNIQSMVTTKTMPMGSINFDGDSIEFVTKYFENRTVKESYDELITTKNLFMEKLNESNVFGENIAFPKYNIGINMFLSNQESLVLFNNGTYHFHITLPVLTENSRIIDYPAFDEMHTNAIYMLQWFEPFFISTLGSPDVMAVVCQKNQLTEQFALGSSRNAMSRYTGVGTFHKSMGKGKILTYKVEDFRKLLKFSKEDGVWWRDQIENSMDYQLLDDIGLDFNQEKMYQSGFEFRSFDEFPITYLEKVLHAIILICEHSLHVPNVTWGHDTKVWNNLVFKALKYGFQTEITQEEKSEVLSLLQIITEKDANYNQIKVSFDQINKLDEFYFLVLDVLFEKYKDQNTCLDALIGEKLAAAPKWENFNAIQVEAHLKQIEGY